MINHIYCPTCGSTDVECESMEYELYVCRKCKTHFSESDDILYRDKSSQYRTRPRKKYMNDSDE